MTSGGTASEEAIPVVQHGPASKKWNLVVLGDGYRQDDEVQELADFHRHVEDFARTLETTPPFDANWSAVNVYRIDVISPDSGADDPVDPTDCPHGTGANPTTYFDATFCSRWGDRRVDRLLTVNAAKAKYIAKNRLPETHQVLVIVNSTTYGGSGGGVAVSSVDPEASRIAIHEMGHSAFSLADEYEEPGLAPPASEPLQPNITISMNRANGKWADLIQAATLVPSSRNPDCANYAVVAANAPAGAVGAFEGGGNRRCGVFRPAAQCRMRALADPFCPVCARVIELVLRPYV